MREEREKKLKREITDADVLSGCLLYTSVVPESDLAQYNQAYLNEGYIDGKLYILPVAKSTELLLMNQPRLDAFLDANPRYREENMESWEVLETVSYTHLDLYKRQTQGCSVQSAGRCNGPVFS